MPLIATRGVVLGTQRSVEAMACVGEHGGEETHRARTTRILVVRAGHQVIGFLDMLDAIERIRQVDQRAGESSFAIRRG